MIYLKKMSELIFKKLDVARHIRVNVVCVKGKFDYRKYKGSYQSLYAGIQCSSCGSRFTPDRVDKYREHLDWHFRQNKREKQEIKVAKFRRWYYPSQQWMQYEEFGDLEERGM